MKAFVESAAFRHGVTALIFLNAILIGLQTYPGIRAEHGQVLHWGDRLILYLFTAEILTLSASSCWAPSSR